MALNILIRTQLSSIPELTPVCFTKDNYDVANETMTVNTPKGVLGGSIAGLSPANNYKVVPCTKALMPVGLFVNDAAGAPFDNSPAVASNKIAVIKGMASVEVDVYETVTVAPYAVGQKLYSSDNGLLTNDVSTSGVVIGVVTKVATPASPTLGLDMRV